MARETESANKANALIFWAGEAVSDDDSSFDCAVDPTRIEDLRQTRKPAGRFGKPDWSHKKSDTVWKNPLPLAVFQFFFLLQFAISSWARWPGLGPRYAHFESTSLFYQKCVNFIVSELSLFLFYSLFFLFLLWESIRIIISRNKKIYLSMPLNFSFILHFLTFVYQKFPNFSFVRSIYRN